MSGVAPTDSLANQPIYVSPTGLTTNSGTENSPWPSVAYALSQVGGGQTIILEPGTYAPILVSRGQGGTATDPTVIESQYKWQAVIDGSLPSWGAAYGLTVDDVTAESPGGGGNTDYVTFEGLKCVNSAAGGILADGNWDTISNCWITGCKNSGIGGYAVDHLSILDNLVEDNGTSTRYDHGIYVTGSQIDIEGNIVRNNTCCGMNLGPYLQDSTVSNNLVYGNLADLWIQDQTANTDIVTNNILLDTPNSVVSYGPNPFASWAGNVVQPSVSGASLDSIESNDVADYAQALALLLPPPSTPNATAPTGRVAYSGLYNGEQMVAVTYSGSQPLALQDIGQNNVTVSGPGGYSARRKPWPTCS